MRKSLMAATRKRRVLVLTSTFPRWRDDEEPRFVLDLSRHLGRGIEILVLAPHTPGAELEEVLEGVRVIRFRYFLTRWQTIAYEGGITARLRANPLRYLQLPFFFASLWLALKRMIHEWQPDVIHAHWIIPQGMLACLAAGGTVPIVCTSHGGDLHALRGPLFERLKAWTLSRCAAITVVSESMVARVRASAEQKPVKVIPMGTDLTSLFVPPPTPSSRESKHLVFVGRLVEKKGVHYLLDALAEIQDTDVRLTIAGEGPLRETLQRKAKNLGIAERVHFMGRIRHKDLPSLYQRATLAVFPFTVARDGDQEGFGLVVVEAMGCGCPVIVGDVPAVRDTVNPGITGILTPPADVLSLSAAIRRVLSDDTLRTQLTSAARIRVLERFDWSIIGARYRRLLDEVVHSHSGRHLAMDVSDHGAA